MTGGGAAGAGSGRVGGAGFGNGGGAGSSHGGAGVRVCVSNKGGAGVTGGRKGGGSGRAGGAGSGRGGGSGSSHGCAGSGVCVPNKEEAESTGVGRSRSEGSRRCRKKRGAGAPGRRRTKRLLCAGTMGRIQKEWMDEGKFSHVHVDGTFCCSTGCQVVAVFGRRHKKDPHPDLLFCAVVNGKFRKDHDMIFAALKQMAPGFSPSTFTGDFEGPMWRSFEEAFGAEFQGCLFHLLDAIGRQLFVKNAPPLFHKDIKGLIRERYGPFRRVLRSQGQLSLGCCGHPRGGCWVCSWVQGIRPVFFGQLH